MTNFETEKYHVPEKKNNTELYNLTYLGGVKKPKNKGKKIMLLSRQENNKLLTRRLRLLRLTGSRPPQAGLHLY